MTTRFSCAFVLALVLAFVLCVNVGRAHAADCIAPLTKRTCETMGWGLFDFEYWYFSCFLPSCDPIYY